MTTHFIIIARGTGHIDSIRAELAKFGVTAVKPFQDSPSLSAETDHNSTEVKKVIVRLRGMETVVRFTCLVIGSEGMSPDFIVMGR